MNRYLLLILLSSWAHVVPLSLQCETGVANPGQVLSVQRSLLANADVALLKTYTAADVNACMKDCCTEKYGSCSVASFKKNISEYNCQHFNCLPIQKCIFLSSNLTDSFSFSSSSSPKILVPSSLASKNISSSSTTTTVKPKLNTFTQTEQLPVTKEAVATYSEEQFALKNDNTSVKPRKGVTDIVPDSSENVSRSGVKPRKGVSFDGVAVLNNTKSKVKPRKGVGPFDSLTPSSSSTFEDSSIHEISHTEKEHSNKPPSASKIYKDVIADDLVSALEKVFEDDTAVKNTKSPVSSLTGHALSNVESTSIKSIESSAVHHPSVIPTSVSALPTMPSVVKTVSSILQSSLAPSQVASSSVQTPNLQTAFVQEKVINHTPMPSSSSPTIFEHSKLLFHEVSVDDGANLEESSENESTTESESERKYKSSMHLVLSLVFGLLVLFSVLGVIAKRVYDGWMRRHYRRMDFLIDGMYNGYG